MPPNEQNTRNAQPVQVEGANERAGQVSLAARIASGDVPSITEIATEIGVEASASLAASLIERTARR